MILQKTGFYLVLLLGIAGQLDASEHNDWVQRSNVNAGLLLDIIAGYNPEQAASFGVDGLDDQILDLKPKLFERQLKSYRTVISELEKRLSSEQHPLVRQDLNILIKAAEDSVRTAQLQRDNLLPYLNMTQTVFWGVRSLIDAQIPQDRYPAAITRLKKYAGIEPGYRPITQLAKDMTAKQLKNKKLIGPYRGEIEQDLERAQTFIDGMKDLLTQSELTGWETAYEAVAKQLQEYNDWVANTLLPRARDDFRMPADLYQDALRNWGVDAEPEQLIRIATQAYMDIRNEMQALAPLVAKKLDLDVTDYRDVIEQLKEKRIPGDELLEYYYARLADLEDSIREHKLVSLPQRDAAIRIATEAETAAQPSAHLSIPRLLGNTGELPEFVLPKLQKDEQGNWIGTDDTYEAGTWTLTAHEARPGHELQFSSMIESGVSTARALFAFNSANVEGWALYAEAIIKPYMPLEGQLISLQYRLARAARMFLDPMLNTGQISAEDAKRLLTDDVVLGESWAQNEIERYTYRIPGQATAYYYGYMNLQSLRTRTELKLKSNFDAMKFHDFILQQGLLPPDLLDNAVMERFVPTQMQ